MNQNIIVTLPAREVRGIARNLLKDHWMPVVLGVAFATIMMEIIPLFFSSCVDFGVVSRTDAYTGQTVEFSAIATFYKLFFTGVFSAGLCQFLLAFVRLKDINPGYVFNGFEFYINTLILYVVQSLFIILWSLLFLIPGIIAVYRYSQSFYILADDPTKGALQCLRESKQMMTGNKGTLFCLQLSFIGWLLLAALPAALMSGFLSTDAESVAEVLYSTKGFIVMFIGIIPVYVVSAYINTAETVFYEILSGHMVFRKREPRYYQTGTEDGYGEQDPPQY